MVRRLKTLFSPYDIQKEAERGEQEQKEGGEVVAKDFSVEPVADMAKTEGYRYLEDSIKAKIQSLLSRLQEEDFEALSDVALLQGKIRALKEILSYVNTRVKKNEGEC